MISVNLGQGGAIALFLLTLPHTVSAAVSNVGGLITYWVGPLTYIIYILFTLAIVVFFWGIVIFIAHAGDEKAVQEGKGFIVWGMVGIFVMVSIWGIVGYLQASLGLDTGGALDDLSLPTYIPGL